ncbi:unnamed protein product [Amoebophrya sp. A25]|nr:unnamed protein product [Amoebophrya sp. A25]|eukprot:GSA25T00015217001.1
MNEVKAKAARAQELRRRLMSNNTGGGHDSAGSSSHIGTGGGASGSSASSTAATGQSSSFRFTRIDNFSGIFGFLHPDHPCKVTYVQSNGQRLDFPCASAALFHVQYGPAFSANLSPDWQERYEDEYPHSAKQLRTAVDALESLESWSAQRLMACEKILRDKFHRSKEMSTSLRETGERPLVWENDCYDIFWGTVQGKGQNQLGRLLQIVRATFRKEGGGAELSEQDEWLYKCAGLSDDKMERTQVVLDEVKEGISVAQHHLALDRALHFVGRQQDICQLVPQHPSTSRRHAAFAYCSGGLFGVTDLGSKAGTKVNARKLDHGELCVLNEGDRVTIGESTRYYRVRFDRRSTQKQLQAERTALLSDLSVDVATGFADIEKQGHVQLFVGGLSFDVTRSRLLQLFREEVKNSLVVEVRLPQEHGPDGGKKGGDDLSTADAGASFDDPKAQRGFGFVTVGSLDEAKKACLALDGYVLEGRSIGVRIAEGGGKGKGKDSKSSKGGKHKDSQHDKHTVGVGRDKNGSFGKEDMKGAPYSALDDRRHTSSDHYSNYPSSSGQPQQNSHYGQQGYYDSSVSNMAPPRPRAETQNAAVARRFVEHAVSGNNAAAAAAAQQRQDAPLSRGENSAKEQVEAKSTAAAAVEAAKRSSSADVAYSSESEEESERSRSRKRRKKEEKKLKKKLKKEARKLKKKLKKEIKSKKRERSSSDDDHRDDASSNGSDSESD